MFEKSIVRASVQRLRNAVAHWAGSRDGIATTEFALTAPIFVILTLGIIDVGNAVFHKFDLNALARIGAEYGVAHSGDADGIRATILNAANRDNTTLEIETEVFCECQYLAAQSCELSCADGSAIRRYIKVSVSEFYLPLFLPDPEKPETENYTFFQDLTKLASQVILRID